MAMGPATHTDVTSEPADITLQCSQKRTRSKHNSQYSRCMQCLLLDLMEQSEQVPPRDVITDMGTLRFFLANPKD
ncbi:hypothetical protein VNO78_30949 [Psophocarpus tetragonolobus]|uniref:Uncharacterized protein n=1 Tax=Psophocarpus tetragonolobus TaxID=3891 RepID=A0AAN9RY23_PSOTE